MDDLVVWLRQQLDDDELLALAASPGPWAPNAESSEVVAVDGITVADGFALSGPQLRATVEHIARHDPAWALCDAEAKRRILEIHKHVRVAAMGWGEDPVEQGAIREKLRPAFPGTSHPWVGCKVCEWDYDKYDEPTGDGDWCDTVKLLALPYSERPGYREQWRP